MGKKKSLYAFIECFSELLGTNLDEHLLGLPTPSGVRSTANKTTGMGVVMLRTENGGKRVLFTLFPSVIGRINKPKGEYL